jgi:hypothetical protein
MSTSATSAAASPDAERGARSWQPARTRPEVPGRELLEVPAEYLAGLPIPVRIHLQDSAIAHQIRWTSEPVAPPSEALVFDADEVRALAVGVQAERLWPADFRGFCLRKRLDPSFRVTEGLALAGAQPEAGPAWSLGRVLRWLELELRGVEQVTPGEPQPSLGAAA